MRKGIVMTTLAAIIIVIAGGTLMTITLTKVSRNSEDRQRETLCKTFNALADQINQKVGDAVIDIAPDACTTIAKDIPEKKYEQSTNGAMRNIADLGIKCWDMFLSGKSDKLFSGKFYKSESKCFICYAVNYQKGKEFKPFDNLHLNEYFSLPTTARDTSDRCNLAGGGRCMDTCSSEYPREVRVSKGVTKEPCLKCCMPESQNRECDAKGGKCLVAPTTEFTDSYPKWKCPSGQSCYVKKQNMVTYNSAIGENGGTFYVDPRIIFLPGATRQGEQASQTYVVAYIHDSKPMFGFLGIGATENIGDLPDKSIFIGSYKKLEGVCDVQSVA